MNQVALQSSQNIYLKCKGKLKYTFIQILEVLYIAYHTECYLTNNKIQKEKLKKTQVDNYCWGDTTIVNVFKLFDTVYHIGRNNKGNVTLEKEELLELKKIHGQKIVDFYNNKCKNKCSQTLAKNILKSNKVYKDKKEEEEEVNNNNSDNEISLEITEQQSYEVIEEDTRAELNKVGLWLYWCGKEIGEKIKGMSNNDELIYERDKRFAEESYRYERKGGMTEDTLEVRRKTHEKLMKKKAKGSINNKPNLEKSVNAIMGVRMAVRCCPEKIKGVVVDGEWTQTKAMKELEQRGFRKFADYQIGGGENFDFIGMANCAERRVGNRVTKHSGENWEKNLLVHCKELYNDWGEYMYVCDELR